MRRGLKFIVSPILYVALNYILPTSAQTDDYYCGTSFISAGEECILPCPSGQDSVCMTALGSEYGCYYFTGCKAKIDNGFVPGPLPGAAISTPAPTEAAVQTPAPIDVQIDVQSPAPTAVVLTPAPTNLSTPMPSASSAIETESPTEAMIIETPSPIATSPSASGFGNAPTNKPTRRTKRPTPPPVNLPDVPTPQPLAPTLSPTKRPVVTASPTFSSVESIRTATEEELKGSSSSLGTAYGFIFSLKTTLEAPVMEVFAIDFLTASTSNLNFELYTKPGSYSGSKVSSSIR